MNIKKYIKSITDLYITNFTETTVSYVTKYTEFYFNPYFSELSNLPIKDKINAFNEIAAELNNRVRYRSTYIYSKEQLKFPIVSALEPLFFMPATRFTQLSLFDRKTSNHDTVSNYIFDGQFLKELNTHIKPDLYRNIYRIILNELILPIAIANKSQHDIKDLLLTYGGYNPHYSIILIPQLCNDKKSLQKIVNAFEFHEEYQKTGSGYEHSFTSIRNNFFLYRRITKQILNYGIQIPPQLWENEFTNSYLTMKYLYKTSSKLAFEYAKLVSKFIFYYHREKPEDIEQLIEILTFLYENNIPLESVLNNKEINNLQSFIKKLLDPAYTHNYKYNAEYFIAYILVGGEATDLNKDISFYEKILSRHLIYPIRILKIHDWKKLFILFTNKPKGPVPWFMLYNQHAQFHPSTINDCKYLLQRTAELGTPYTIWTEVQQRDYPIRNGDKFYITKIPLINRAILSNNNTFYKNIAKKADMFEFSQEVYDVILKKVTPYMIAEPESYKKFTSAKVISQESLCTK